MRTLALLAAGGIVLGIALGLLVAWLRPAQRLPVCTAQLLGLAPTVGFTHNHAEAELGLAAPTGDCIVQSGASRAVRILATSARGRVIVDHNELTGPPPGVPLARNLRSNTRVPAAILCRAAQPVDIEVWVAGAHIGATQRFQFVGRRCALAS